MINKTFEKSLYHLSHPISLFSIILLFFNDHILRVFWSSWVSGKLGDFAWLYFMPFALTAILALLIPSSLRNHTKIVGYLSFSIIGILFVLGNTLPSTNQYMVDWLEGFLSIPIQIIRDPTDLIALSSFSLGWLLWQSQKKEIPKAPSKGKAVILLPVAALLTIANAAAPDHGIDCLLIENNKIVASTYWGDRFASEDGGLSWTAIERNNNLGCDPAWDGIVADPEDENTLYRIGEEEKVERSIDKGEHWEVVPEISLASQAEIAFNQLNKNPLSQYTPGPFYAIRDPQTNNLILAMGLEGVLVHKPSGECLLVPVGEYGLGELTTLMIPILLIGEILLALELALLVFCALSLFKIRTWFRIGLIIFLWLVWIFITVELQPALNSSYGLLLQNMLLLFIGVIALWNTIDNVFRISREYSKEMVYRLTKISILGLVTFLFPYVLWAVDIIPEYMISMAFSLLFCAVILFLGIRKMINTEKESVSP